MPPSETSREILLAPQEYAYMQKEGNGTVSVHVGPGAIAATQQDVPIVYDTKQQKYTKRSLDQSVQQFPRAAEGEYVILENPSDDGNFPQPNSNSPSKNLQIGLRQVIPGPWCQALWPGQSATVLAGHRLRTNQYAIAVVYNEEQAEANWDKTIVKAQTEVSGDEKGEKSKLTGLSRPESFAVGTRIIIKGTEASFYIPPTGIEVARDENTGEYVREAVTLEQLEYCCLIDESGKKEYPKGPDVVFPRATQVFDMDSRKRRKWKAIELNTINGIHLKVVADFEGEDITSPSNSEGERKNRKYKEGEELFITGSQLSIYYPREEFSIVEYGQGNKKHFSTAIPKGEGRYVINRETGEVSLTVGPKMLLCNPIQEIPVRRVLSRDECELWYPGNSEAIQYNASLEVLMQDSPSGRSGLLSEGDYRKATERSLKKERSSAPESLSLDEGGGNSITRGTTYTEPRTLTLNTKYDGVPRIEVWPGYAVLVVGSEGSRKVLEGPQIYLMEYDEKLGHQYLSTNKPKSTDHLLKTAYLQVQNNQVGDIVGFESKDHVKGTVKISLRVNFEGQSDEDKLRWFSVDNYVKYLCDHVRSILSGMAKRHPIADIKAQYVDLVRDSILGSKGGVKADDDSVPEKNNRKGLYFEDNGMRVIEVEVLELSLNDSNIERLLDEAQHEVVQTDIELAQARKRLETIKEKELISQSTMAAQSQTELKRLELEYEKFTQMSLFDEQKIGEKLSLALTSYASTLQELEKKKEIEDQEQKIYDLKSERQLGREQAAHIQKFEQERSREALKLETLKAETEAAKDRFESAKEGLGEIVVALHRDDIAAKIAEATNMQRFFSGDDIGSSLTTLFSEFPILQALNERGRDAANNLSGNRLKQGQTAQSDS